MTNSPKTKNFYITTTLPYVNGKPHVGFAMEIVRADIIARWKKISGFNVFFNTGTDEHGIKVYRGASEAGREPQEYVNEYSQNFRNLIGALNISNDIHFIRTTDQNHKISAQEFWKKCASNGDIYKKNYEIKYCIGCELEKTDSELVDGHCVIHPNLEIEIISEENYFFKFSKYQERLLDLYNKNPNFVIPDFRFNEIKRFVERGLQDFSISRLKEKMSWGVEVPDDPQHVMYVWFDALVNYISTLGWPENTNLFEDFWVKGETVQYAGKDNLRQQSAMWQAMLMSAGIEATNQIVINGFINFEGQKMSKSLGNITDPFQIAKEYGVDALRYHIGREFSSFEDSDFSLERFKESYNANLANGLGNLTSRIMKMAQTNLPEAVRVTKSELPLEFTLNLNKFEIQKATNLIWEKIGELDSRIQETKPFKLIKEDKEGAIKIIEELCLDLYKIAEMLEPIMPSTSQQIKHLVANNKSPEKSLFPRKD